MDFALTKETATSQIPTSNVFSLAGTSTVTFLGT
jgi:hypothetical protein